MDEFVTFIEEVIEAVYTADVSRHHHRDNIFEKKVAKAESLFERPAGPNITRPPGLTPEEIQELGPMVRQIVARKLFEVRRADHPQLGAVYFAFLGGARESQGDRVCDVYAAVKRGEDFKVITTFTLVDNQWRHSGAQLGQLKVAERRELETPKNAAQIGDGLPLS